MCWSLLRVEGLNFCNVFLRFVGPPHRCRLQLYFDRIDRIFFNLNIIDLFSLYVLLPHYRPRDGTLENHCFQILKYLRVYE